MELALVLVVVGLAAFFLARRARRSLGSGGSGGGCGCGTVKPGCSAPKATDPVQR